MRDSNQEKHLIDHRLTVAASKNAQRLFLVASPAPIRSQWCPPDFPVVKLNFDASWSVSTGAAFGIVARDHTGSILAWCHQSFRHAYNPETAEALAARTTASFAVSCYFRKVILEVDCLSVINKLKAPFPSSLDIGGLREDTKISLASCDSFYFSFV